MDETAGKPFDEVLIGGLRTACLSREALARLMLADCLAARAARETWRPKLVFSSNAQGVALAGRNTEFAQLMAEADIVHADGMPVVMASRLTARPLPERICTTDFFHDAAAVAAGAGLSFYVFGASERQNAMAVAAMLRLYPRLRIAGRRHGYFQPEENEAICAEIRASGADVLWVALGKPRQERWSADNRARLKGVGWIKTCGGLYSYLAEDVPRAPAWMRKAALEWLFRMVREPGRLGPRYLATNPYAAWRLLRCTERRPARSDG